MNLALWIVAIVLAVAFAGSGLMKQFVPKDKLVTAGQGWAQGLQPDQYPIDRTRRDTRRHRASPAGRSAYRPDPRPLGSDRVGSRNGRCGHRSRPAQRTNECRGQPGADRLGRLRGLGPFRAVFVYAVTKFH
jgi:hypothetical protein